jgi:hypothetical protein
MASNMAILPCTVLHSAPHRTKLRCNALQCAALTHLDMLQLLAGQRSLAANLAFGRQGHRQWLLLQLFLLPRRLLLPLLLLLPRRLLLSQLLLLPLLLSSLLLPSLVARRRLTALQAGHRVLGHYNSQELRQLLWGLDQPAEQAW